MFHLLPGARINAIVMSSVKVIFPPMNQTRLPQDFDLTKICDFVIHRSNKMLAGSVATVDKGFSRFALKQIGSAAKEQLLVLVLCDSLRTLHAALSMIPCVFQSSC
jgi:hypothetical protein